MTTKRIIRPDPRESKIGLVSTDRTIAQVAAPAPTTGQSQMRIKASTYFTRAGAPEIVYDGTRIWARVTLTLRTAGPVAVGEQAEITPVLSGSGILLITNEPKSFDLAKSNRLYIAANGFNRVDLIIAAYPWAEEITGRLGLLTGLK